MAGEAEFKRGDNVQQVPHTPGAAVAAGTVIPVGVKVYIANVALEANRLGDVAAGGGTYTVTSDGSVGAGGAAVYWNNTAKKVTTTAAGNNHFGYSVPDQGASSDGDRIEVEHTPVLGTGS